MSEQIVKVINCRRCGQDHLVEFKGLLNPFDDFNIWSICPKTNQPLLLKAEFVVCNQR
ncbi:hypothetical protein HPT25_23675 [Bacillus sp. BRMEA1]|uniref:hypothetical protein n=1 Tax=Neobacillus endophyticus TaxID=2738405 RepID=UPI001565E564|nr:hypothetical protein [Neobacillus endophyticus]NRD80326.1 hypothetical protein [Neobacillus endophyticus]